MTQLTPLAVVQFPFLAITSANQASLLLRLGLRASCNARRSASKRSSLSLFLSSQPQIAVSEALGRSRLYEATCARGRNSHSAVHFSRRPGWRLAKRTRARWTASLCQSLLF